MTRRQRGWGRLVAVVMLAPLAAGLGGAGAAAEDRSAAPVLNESGLYTEPWFLESFLDMRDDLAEARRNGKRFVVIFEQEGCPYCREMHLVNFADPKISGYVRANFEVVELDLWGARKVTDFDGTVLSEKAFARKYKVRFTPTVLFFANRVPPGQAGQAAEVARVPGYLPPKYFRMFFEYVRTEAFKTTGFRAWVKRRLAGQDR